MSEKIKLGISTCLLGEKVRYDGGHKWDRYLTNIVGPFVEWVPVCPEVECGLPTPREAMHLAGDPESPRLVTLRSNMDHTERMHEWSKKRLVDLETQDLCGFIFKTRSPSSGMRDIKIYKEDGNPTSNKTAGLFAKAFMDRFPLIPVEDEGRLNDAGLRENFIERVFVFHRWKEYLKQDRSAKGLVDFHTRHKLMLMAHSETHMRKLGKRVADIKHFNFEELLDQYFRTLMQGLKVKATVKKNVNVLDHILGYFKKQLTADEKLEMRDIISQYHNNLVPLIVPVTLLKHYIRKYEQPYLLDQVYLTPHPAELALRNHV
ncbi:MAG: DUF523 and DUF1722 domain-containing protein [candidate division KSB1 bacterium]|nr:DUF523 and DUF1722 domain-containing protein [candidate division KSB1 bacterium]